MATDQTIANTILEHLGGSKFLAMTGARDLTCGEYHLTMRVGGRYKRPGLKTARRVTHIRITLKPNDLYNMEAMFCSVERIETIAGRADIYCDGLQSAFAELTGLRVSL